MFKKWLLKGLMLVLIVCFFNSYCFAEEALSSELSRKLGISPYIVERFETFYEYQVTEADKARPEAEFCRIITKIRYAHAGDGVHLWRIDFAGDHFPVDEPAGEFNHTALMLYIDVDDNLSTGRAGLGIEEQISANNRGMTDGSINVTRVSYTASGSRITDSEPLPTVVLDGASLYIRCDDINIEEENGRLSFMFMINSEGWIASQDRNGGISKTGNMTVTANKADGKYYWTPGEADPSGGLQAGKAYIYPNPFIEEIRIPLYLKMGSQVSLSIYDESGRRVYGRTERVDNPGYNEIGWNSGNSPAGIYSCLISLATDDGNVTRLYGLAVKEGL
jgi:hypothetical protein